MSAFGTEMVMGTTKACNKVMTTLISMNFRFESVQQQVGTDGQKIFWFFNVNYIDITRSSIEM